MLKKNDNNYKEVECKECTEDHIDYYIKDHVLDNKYNTYLLKSQSINFFIEDIVYSAYIIKQFNNNTINSSFKDDMYKFINIIMNNAKKENYEIIYIIILFQELISKKNNIINLIEFVLDRKIKTLSNYIIGFKIVFCLLSLIIGKFYDDCGMINDDYVIIMRNNINCDINLKELNDFELKILIFLNFHIKLDYLDKFVVVSDQILNYFSLD